MPGIGSGSRLRNGYMTTGQLLDKPPRGFPGILHSYGPRVVQDYLRHEPV